MRTFPLLFTLLLTTTASLRAADLTSRPLPSTKATAGTPQFQSIPLSASGVDFTCPIDLAHPLKQVYVSAFGCGGVAVGDVDGDGRPDLYLVSGPGKNGLYRQTGAFKFEDVTAKAGVDGGEAWGAGAAMVDIDNDGDLDIYVCNYESPNQLFLNDGVGVFEEQARAFGLAFSEAFLMAAFSDYDRDGDLDLYLLGHRYFRDGGRPNRPPTLLKNGKLVVRPEFKKYYGLQQRGNKLEINEVGASDRLLRNDSGPDGKIRFTDVSTAAGIATDPDQGNSVMWFDYNHDGWPDIFVGNDFEFPDRLYRNNRNGTFSEMSRMHLPHTTWFSMGSDCTDLNNDGLIDFMCVDMSGTTHYKAKTTMGAMGRNKWFMETADPPQYMRNCLFLNTGTPRFMELAFQSGTANSDWSWAVKFGDLDNDGHSDLFISNGMSRNFNDSDNPLKPAQLVGRTEWELYEDTPPRPEQNLAFRNLGNLRFEDVSKSWGLDAVAMSYAAAHADFDRDGHLDLVVVNLDEPVRIYRNTGTPGHARVALKLRGEQSNRFGIGAQVEIETDAGRQIRQFNPMRGFSSCDDPLVHFGLGQAKSIKRLTVRWPSGTVQTLNGLAPDQEYTIHENASEANTVIPGPEPSPAPLFGRSDVIRGVSHWETPFDDFSSQPLLPNRLSQLGPGLACGDMDGDGDDDLYLSGCAGYLGQVLTNNGPVGFQTHEFSAGSVADESEELGALFFEADGDGDPDLYLVSGSVEAPSRHASLRDRLYLNQGRGQQRQYAAAPSSSLPANTDSGSTVAAADFDRDGDLDLFVGGRVNPGRYPTSPGSRLLVNQSRPEGAPGTFRDLTADLAPALRTNSMVTGALWSDANGDGWLDLLLSTEWGPVRYFENEMGKLVERTREAGLGSRFGWWTGVSGGDFDHDGDIDYLATNFGLNTKYHASMEAPEILYYGDLDGTGQSRLVEAGFEQGQCFPHRGFSCSSHAMPLLRDKLKTYDQFARATLPELYTENRLAAAQKYQANTLESGILLNDGKAKFVFKPLPPLAQISPAFGSAVTDCDGDGHLDLYLVHNFFTPQIETRPMDTGLSLLLRGNGDGTFNPVWPKESGLIVPGDAKSLVVTDLNADARPDFVIGVNDGEILAFENHAPASRHLAVKLRGHAGNPQAIGARVHLVADNRAAQTQEVTAGSGYLSQSSATLFFGLGQISDQVQVQVRWPDGKSTRHRANPAQQPVLSISAPDPQD